LGLFALPHPDLQSVFGRDDLGGTSSTKGTTTATATARTTHRAMIAATPALGMPKESRLHAYDRHYFLVMNVVTEFAQHKQAP
jgi:hypothetical protein